MPNTPYAVTISFHVRPDAVERMESIVAEVTGPSLGEDGMQVYRWSQCAEDPTRFLLYMEWEDRESFDLHMDTPHVKQAKATIEDGMLAEPYVQRFYNRI